MSTVSNPLPIVNGLDIVAFTDLCDNPLPWPVHKPSVSSFGFWFSRASSSIGGIHDSQSQEFILNLELTVRTRCAFTPRFRGCDLLARSWVCIDFEKAAALLAALMYERNQNLSVSR